MTESFVVIICIIAIYRLLKYESDGFPLGIVYAFLCAVLTFAPIEFVGLMHYLTLGATDLLILFLAFRYAKQTRFTDCIVCISVLSILVNCYGWGIYELEMEPTSYNTASYALYLVAILVFLWRDGANDSVKNTRNNWLFMPYRKRSNVCGSLREEAEL